MPHHLSKSKLVAGLQCEKLLWWIVHEPDAPELTPDAGLQRVFDRGHRVGALARERFPGGVLIDVPYEKLEERVERTREALAARAAAIFEASFLAEGVFVALDILERRRGYHVLTEVKSTLDVKPEHLPDVAIQLHVARAAGLYVRRAEVMHLNRACRAPRLHNLFVRENVTLAAQAALPHPARTARRLLRALDGPLPDVPTGRHCTEPHVCPFLERCWPPRPEHHVSSLAGIRQQKVETLVAAGIETLDDLPADYPAKGAAARQIKAVQSRQLVVEPGLAEALTTLEPPLAYLDFETISPAIPAWRGCGPYASVPVQFSLHVERDVGSEARLAHHEWLADGPHDPRASLAQALVQACAGANTVLAYFASFERGCLLALAKAVPELRRELLAIAARLRDLHALVRDHVYHPAFGGSFSLKSVLPALVPGMDYADLDIQEGGTAMAALEELLLGEAMPEAERLSLRRSLLAYCERDTLAMVRLHERLRGLSGAPPS